METARAEIGGYLCSERDAEALLLALASRGLTVVESDLAGAAWRRMMRPQGEAK